MSLTENRVIVGDGIGSLYAVTVVALKNQVPVARSPIYIFNRTGVYQPEDILWSEDKQRRFLGTKVSIKQ